MEIKTPPYNSDYEKIVIGSSIIDPSSLNKLLKFTDKILFLKSSQTIYSILQQLRLEGAPVDLNTIFERLIEVKDREFILEAVELARSTVGPVDWYLAELKKLYLKREMMRLGLELSDITDKSPAEIANELKEKLERLEAETKEPTKVERLKEFIEELTALKERGQEMSLGFPTIDDYVNGLRRKRLYVIGGLPSSGKTQLALQIANSISACGKKVLFFSLEISYYDAVARLVSIIYKIPSWKMQKAWYLSKEELVTISNIKNILQNRPLEIVCSISNPSEIISLIDYHKPDLVIVDHLQYIPLLDANSQYQKRHEIISKYVKMLRDEAKKKNFCCILLSQISREYTDSKKTPHMAWFQASSGIEQQADVAIIIHHADASLRTLLGAWIVKNRNGTGGVGKEVKIAFNVDTLTYSEIYDYENKEEVKNEDIFI